MLRYPATIKYDKTDKAWYVNFPDLKGCFTDGETLDEARAAAKEVLNGYLEVAFARNVKVHTPSEIKGKDVYYFTPDLYIAFAIQLRMDREKKGLSQGEIAKRLGVSYQAYQKLETPAKSNPTLKTIAKLESVLGTELVRLVG